MKIIKFGLRFWITLGSVVSFLFGWAIFGHSLKPAQLVSRTSAETLPPLEPIPPVLSFTDGPRFEQPQTRAFQPRVESRPMFVTSGS